MPALYLQSLHESYEDWLIHEKLGPLPAKVLVLDADHGLEHMINTYEQHKVGEITSTALDNVLLFRTRSGGRSRTIQKLVMEISIMMMA